MNDGHDPEEHAENQTQQSPLKHQMIARFAQWLDSLTLDATELSGLDRELAALVEAGKTSRSEESGFDLYTLWSGMTVLSQEVKLQGRTFKLLIDSLMPLQQAGRILENLDAEQTEILASLQQLHERTDSLAQLRSPKSGPATESVALTSLLDVLLDLRDRLVRGVDLHQDHRKRITEALERKWFKKPRGSSRKALETLIDASDALKEGYVLSLQRLEDLLNGYDIQEIPCRGKQFDPRLMRAVEVEVRAELSEGQVLEVYRTGYLRNGEVYRPAHVKVAQVQRRREQVKETEV